MKKLSMVKYILKITHICTGSERFEKDDVLFVGMSNTIDNVIRDAYHELKDDVGWYDKDTTKHRILIILKKLLNLCGIEKPGKYIIYEHKSEDVSSRVIVSQIIATIKKIEV